MRGQNDRGGQDILGRSASPGDTVMYCTRSSSTITYCVGVVTRNLGDGGIEVERKGGRSSYEGQGDHDGRGCPRLSRIQSPFAIIQPYREL